MADLVDPFPVDARLALLDRLPELVAVLDDGGRIRWANRTMLDTMGFELDELLGTVIFDHVHPDDLNYMIASWEKRGANPGDPGLIVQGRARNRDGTWRPCEVIGIDLFGHEVGGMVITCRDLTHQSALADSPARLRSLVDRTTDIVVLLDPDGTFVYANRRLTALLGHDSDGVVGSSWTTVLHEDDLAKALAWFDQLVQAGDGASSRVQVRLSGRMGRSMQVELNGTNQVDDPLIGGVIVAARDIGDLVEMQRALEERTERLAHAATHDTLTGLLNRSAFVGAVDELISEVSAGTGSATESGRVTVLFCDLDGFKQVNDEHGHHVGDQVLIEVADRLRATVTDDDVVGRYGGDEFTVLLARDESDVMVAALVSRLTSALTEPIIVGHVTTRVGVSVGVSRGDARTTDVDSLLSEADAAMYERKRTRVGDTPTF